MRAKQDVRDETPSLAEKIATAAQKSTNIKQSGSECGSISLPTIILQDRLTDMFTNAALDNSDQSDPRIPFKWTLMAIFAICGAFWAILAENLL